MECGKSIACAIRVTTSKDAQSISDLLETSYPALMQDSYEEPVLAAGLSLICRANPSLLASGTYYIAETEDKVVVGCGGWTRERPGQGDVVPGLGHVRHFATHPAWLGQGIGRAIYLVCEQEARRAGVTQLECYSTMNAEGFYTALGFKYVGRFDVNLSNSVSLPGILMRRSI